MIISDMVLLVWIDLQDQLIKHEGKQLTILVPTNLKYVQDTTLEFGGSKIAYALIGLVKFHWLASV